MNGLETSIFLQLYGSSPQSPWVLAMAALTVVGNGWVMVTFVPLLLKARTRRFGMALLGSLLSTALLVLVTKRLVGRPRPCASGFRALVFPAPTDFSFPSGHAAGSFAFAAFVAVVLVRNAPPGKLGRRFGAALLVFALAGAIGASRIVLGMHFPVDVLAGAALGTALGALGGTLYVAANKPGQASVG